MRKNATSDLRDGYRIRILSSVVAALTILILLVRYWPAREPHALDLARAARSEDVITIEEIRPTRQRTDFRPPPPAPIPPVVVPNDQILEQAELDLSPAFLPILEPSQGEPSGRPEGAAVVISEGPKPVKFVEPEYTREAQRRRIRAEVVVSVLVDEQGRVRDARVLERYILARDDAPRELVSSIGYGLEEAAMSAAERWLYRPARRDGQPIESETTITFRFGV